jgi:hypothetical protein
VQVGSYFGGSKGGDVGATVGGALGGLAPYHTGGLVKKGRTRAKLLPGEYVLPRGVRPTASQRKAVAAKKRAAGGKGGRGKK